MFVLKKHFVPRLLTLGLILASPVLHSEVVFEENFDDQPDWTSAMHSTDTEQRAVTHIIPHGWSAIRQDPTWAPSKGHPYKHESIEVLASNSKKCRDGTGKCMVSWRDSYNPGWKRWTSESIMLKYLPEGYSQLYVEFWIRFGPNWTRTNVDGVPSAASKLFRISSWRGNGSEFQAFPDGDIGPIALWDYSLNKYGVRNTISWRGGPHGDNYNYRDGEIPGLPAPLINTGDLNLNFSGHLKGMGPGGSDPKVSDRLNGGLIDLNSPSIVKHDQVFGPGDSWTKIGIFVKMNSAPGLKDGVFQQWLNDEQVFISTTIPWIRPSVTETENAQWNLVAIGGNDFFQIYPNEAQHEEWYAIDDLIIRDDVPHYLNTTAVAPNPPIGLDVK
ncbi:hypothetical protein [Marinobacter sp. DY40_1A1]|uniref:hypothetical protein n=1 Tax=Marinobacter sp. DY40_1A1 TaxID=2583229 RepID=UPI0019065A7A|nr:hypothetical protein [Marinobacter sp. DY40_1A1]